MFRPFVYEASRRAADHASIDGQLMFLEVDYGVDDSLV